jgi:SAM-dependent methyltransferase
MSDSEGGVLTRNPYERLYCSQGGKPLWGRDPGRLVSGIDRWVCGGTVLDAGCGDGKNSLYLERQGFKVLGVDVSRTALTAMRQRAAEAGQIIEGRYVVADLERFSIDEAFDVIVSYGLYHCLNRQRRVEVHKGIQDLVVPDGVVLFTCLIDGIPLPADHFDMQLSLPSKSEILELFEDSYRIEHWEVGSIIEEHPPLVDIHEHQAVWIVARKVDNVKADSRYRPVGLRQDGAGENTDATPRLQGAEHWRSAG